MVGAAAWADPDAEWGWLEEVAVWAAEAVAWEAAGWAEDNNLDHFILRHVKKSPHGKPCGDFKLYC